MEVKQTPLHISVQSFTITTISRLLTIITNVKWDENETCATHILNNLVTQLPILCFKALICTKVLGEGEDFKLTTELSEKVQYPHNRQPKTN